MRVVLTKILVFISFAVCLILCMGAGCNPFYKTTIKDVEEYLAEWDITLPEDAELNFWCSKIYFTDGLRYGVIGFRQPPSDLIENFSYERDEPLERQTESRITYLSNEEDKEIPLKYFPKWEEEYCWKTITSDSTHNTVNLFYFTESYELKILIEC